MVSTMWLFVLSVALVTTVKPLTRKQSWKRIQKDPSAELSNATMLGDSQVQSQSNSTIAAMLAERDALEKTVAKLEAQLQDHSKRAAMLAERDATEKTIAKLDAALLESDSKAGRCVGSNEWLYQRMQYGGRCNNRCPSYVCRGCAEAGSSGEASCTTNCRSIRSCCTDLLNSVTTACASQTVTSCTTFKHEWVNAHHPNACVWISEATCDAIPNTDISDQTTRENLLERFQPCGTYENVCPSDTVVIAANTDNPMLRPANFTIGQTYIVQFDLEGSEHGACLEAVVKGGANLTGWTHGGDWGSLGKCGKGSSVISPHWNVDCFKHDLCGVYKAIRNAALRDISLSEKFCDDPDCGDEAAQTVYDSAKGNWSHYHGLMGASWVHRGDCKQWTSGGPDAAGNWPPPH